MFLSTYVMPLEDILATLQASTIDEAYAALDLLEKVNDDDWVSGLVDEELLLETEDFIRFIRLDLSTYCRHQEVTHAQVL